MTTNIDSQLNWLRKKAEEAKELSVQMLAISTEMFRTADVIEEKLSVSNTTDELKPATKDYFSDAELFHVKDKFDPDLLSKLNILRENWGHPILVSPVKGAVIRYDSSGSYHNYNKWGKCRAIDVFPKIVNGGIHNKEDAIKFVKLARKVGFTGIGVYPHFKPSFGVHLDNRETPCEWIDTAKYPAHNYVYGQLEKLIHDY